MKTTLTIKQIRKRFKIPKLIKLIIFIDADVKIDYEIKGEK